MKQFLVFIALAIFSFCLTTCDKEIVVSEPHMDDFHTYIMVSVKDDRGYAISNVEIKLVLYSYLCDTTSRRVSMYTDEEGEIKIYSSPYIKEEFDAIKIFPSMDGYLGIPDSYMTQFPDAGQNILCIFTMYEIQE